MMGGMKILNLACGTKTSSKPEVINIDWSAYLRIGKSPLLRAGVRLLLSGDRLERYRGMPGNIMLHDLRKQLPFAPESVDAVYHSHFLEHLDRDFAEELLLEIKRVLKAGGVQRIVVPDFERVCREYLSHILECGRNPAEASRHDHYIAAIIEQSIRREAHGTSRQKPFRRLIENALLGDARRRGETHQWMYDRISLPALLLRLGYRDIRLQTHSSSLIPDWYRYGLDLDSQGREYKPASLYVEALK